MLHVVLLTSFHCDVTTVQPLDGPFYFEVTIKKSAKRCDVGPLAKGQLYIAWLYVYLVLDMLELSNEFQSSNIRRLIYFELKNEKGDFSAVILGCITETYVWPLSRLWGIAGEIVPRRNRTQEKSYPNWMGTISLEKSNPGYDFSRDIVPKVRFIQRYRTLRLKNFNKYFLIYSVNTRFSVLKLLGRSKWFFFW